MRSSLAILVVLLAGLACAPSRVVYTDDEVPLTAPLEAQAGPDALERDDPPGRVVRLDYAAGAVSRQPAGLDEWAPALVNQPLDTGDRLWVAPEGQAELHAGATGVRLGQGTGLDVLGLDDRSLQLGLQRGTVELRILPGRDADTVEVDTPSGAVQLDRPGVYRVDADEDGQGGRVTVRSGLAEVTAAGQTVPVEPGATLELTGGDTPTYAAMAARDPDAFDQWCATRERREDGSESALYVGRDMMGYEDLDGQGTWRVDPVNGTAWVPRVAAGWAPYRDGRWVWSEPWGWTWVDAQPWGFAPSHYGRWAYADNTWMWVPHAEGMRMVRPVYAPALVAFAGGPGFRGAVSAGGGVAWFPLGPREPYVPAYPASRAYLQGLNAAAITPGAAPVPGGFYANQAIPGAMTVVPRSVFTGAQPVAAAALSVHGPALGQAVRVGFAPALAPRRESLLASAPGESPASRPPVAGLVRPLQVRRLPQAAVPFEARQAALAAGQGRPLSRPAWTGLRAAGAAGQGFPARLATTPGSGGGLRPARPGFFPGRPFGTRPFIPPAEGRSGFPGQGQAGGWGGNPRPEPAQRGQLQGEPRQGPGGNQPRGGQNPRFGGARPNGQIRNQPRRGGQGRPQGRRGGGGRKPLVP